jgi:hypothetical protein
MTLKQYFLVSAGIFVLVVAAVHYLSVPILPFAMILVAGETILGFQVEDGKVARMLTALFRAPKHHAPPADPKHV